MPAIYVNVFTRLELMPEAVMPNFVRDREALPVRMICLLHGYKDWRAQVQT